MWSGGFYGNRKSQCGGCQGDVWVFHDIAGDGRSVADPDEGQPGNTETDWWACEDPGPRLILMTSY